MPATLYARFTLYLPLPFVEFGQLLLWPGLICGKCWPTPPFPPASAMGPWSNEKKISPYTEMWLWLLKRNYMIDNKRLFIVHTSESTTTTFCSPVQNWLLKILEMVCSQLGVMLLGVNKCYLFKLICVCFLSPFDSSNGAVLSHSISIRTDT